MSKKFMNKIMKIININNNKIIINRREEEY
jgi:hypothetical protein